jgi:hypothetical protein
VHNVHGPHDASFYKLLGELEEEWYDLKRKGYSGTHLLFPLIPALIIPQHGTGDGFQSDGARLGGSPAIPQHIGRIKGLEAAERRAQKSSLMGKGGRLGGSGPVGGVVKSPREMAVEVRVFLHSFMDREAEERFVGRGTKTPRRQIM